MAELAAAGVAAQYLPELQRQAGEAGKAIQVYMVDVLTRSLDRFDYEKVFVEGIVCTAIFAVIKIVYWIYGQVWLTTYNITHPIPGITDFWSCLGVFGGFFSLFESIGRSPDILEEEKAKMEVERKKDWFLYYGKPVFEDYWVMVILGIWAIFVLVEKRRVDTEHRKRKVLMRLASQ